MSSHTIVALDIETARDDSRDVAAGMRLVDKVDSRLKNKEKVEAAWQAKLDAAGLDACYGRIALIGYQYSEQEPCALTAETVDEHTLLSAWCHNIEIQRRATPGNPDRLKFVGHNILGFDLPFLWRRMIVNGLKPPFWLPAPAMLKPWLETVGDTNVMWAGVKGYISLKRLAWTLGVEGKTEGMDGSKVQGLVDAKEWRQLADYCLQDLSTALACYRRMTP